MKKTPKVICGLNALVLAAALHTVPLHAQVRDADLLARAQAEQPAVLGTLERLVNIETFTGDAEGLATMAAYLESELKGLGGTVMRHAAANGAVGHNVEAVFIGKGERRLMLIAHMDTVHPRGALKMSPFRVDGNRAYGPGIADDKSGIAVILHTLRLLRQSGFDGYGRLTVLFTCDEENGSPGSNALIRELARRQDHVLSFEPTLAAFEGTVLSMSGAGRIEAHIKGRASHAGASPERGVNAVVEAADLIARTQQLDDPANGIRFNWTMVRGGDKSNVIPDEARLTADYRFADATRWRESFQKLEDAAARKRLAQSQVELRDIPVAPAYRANAKSREMIDRAVAIYRELGAKLTVFPTVSGFTDAVWAAQDGVPTAEGFGLAGFNFHTSLAEYVLVDAIPRRLYLAGRMLKELSEAAPAATP